MLVVRGPKSKLTHVDAAETGVYLDDCQLKRPSKWASDVDKAERLWRLSEDLVGEEFTRSKDSRL
jgi:hypothetical protein